MDMDSQSQPGCVPAATTSGSEPSAAIKPDLEERIQKGLRSLPWQVRLQLRLQWMGQDILRRTPGYNDISWTLTKVRRQGLAALWTPVFSLPKQDRSTFDKRLRWHGWGVLLEDGHYRAYTPTRRTAERFYTPEAAWDTLERPYHGRGAEVRWISLTPSPASPAERPGRGPGKPEETT